MTTLNQKRDIRLGFRIVETLQRIPNNQGATAQVISDAVRLTLSDKLLGVDASLGSVKISAERMTRTKVLIKVGGTYRINPRLITGGL